MSSRNEPTSPERKNEGWNRKISKQIVDVAPYAKLLGGQISCYQENESRTRADANYSGDEDDEARISKPDFAQIASLPSFE
jgi:hypothetical protein